MPVFSTRRLTDCHIHACLHFTETDRLSYSCLFTLHRDGQTVIFMPVYTSQRWTDCHIHACLHFTETDRLSYSCLFTLHRDGQTVIFMPVYTSQRWTDCHIHACLHFTEMDRLSYSCLFTLHRDGQTVIFMPVYTSQRLTDCKVHAFSLQWKPSSSVAVKNSQINSQLSWTKTLLHDRLHSVFPWLACFRDRMHVWVYEFISLIFPWLEDLGVFCCDPVRTPGFIALVHFCAVCLPGISC